MKIPMVLIMALGLVIVPPLPGRAGDPEAQILYEKDRGSTVTLKLGQRLRLYLRNPASGGYQTEPPIFAPGLLRLLAQKPIPPEPQPAPRMGDFGQLFYEWEAMGVGATDLVINIYRPLEKKAPKEYWRVKVIITR